VLSALSADSWLKDKKRTQKAPGVDVNMGKDKCGKNGFIKIL
jgi:hypothetical protein